MALDSYDSIFQQFAAVSADEWKNKIIKDLKGEPFDKLSRHTKEDIEVLPFYTKEDNRKYRLLIPEKQAENWQITERIYVKDVAEANKTALNALQNGATSLLFDLDFSILSKEQTGILLKEVLTDIAPVIFERYQEENKTHLEEAVKNSCPAAVIIPEQETITDELVYALKYGMENNNDRFHFYIQQNYFFEIAKLRAFRWLWKHVCELQNKPYSIFIQCETSTKSFNTDNENNNILRNTTAAMSAIIGGCDSLIVNSHDAVIGETSFGKRIARNVQHILRHESYFNELQDAAKGSYYIEYLTYRLCEKSWKNFNLSH